MEFITLNNGVKMPMAGIGTFLLSPDEAEASCISALENGCRLIDTANAYMNEKSSGPRDEKVRPQAGRNLPGDEAVACLL